MKAIFLMALLVWSTAAFANKGVSGGNGVGGTLLDPQTYEQGQRVEGALLEQTLIAQHPHIAREFPFFKRLVFELTQGSRFKYWYLEDRALNPACLNPVTVKASQQILACQNAIEVRINRTWWNEAAPRDRAALLLHEILTALRFSDARFETVPLATSLFLNPQLDAKTVADELGRLRFPNFLPTDDVAAATRELTPFIANLCLAESDEDHKRVDDDFTMNWKAGNLDSYRAIQAVLDTQIFLRDTRIDGSAVCGISADGIGTLIEGAWIRKALRPSDL